MPGGERIFSKLLFTQRNRQELERNALKYDIETQEYILCADESLDFKDAYTIQVSYKLFAYTTPGKYAEWHTYHFKKSNPKKTEKPSPILLRLEPSLAN